MYAIIEDSGRQYRVEEGETLYTEKHPQQPGEEITFDRIIMVGNDDDVQIGKPYLAGASVKATVLEQVKGPKIHVIKFKGRKKYRRKQGHRQNYTALRIDQITLS